MRFMLNPVLFIIPFAYVQCYKIYGNRSNITEILQWHYHTGVHDEGYDGWKTQFANHIASWQDPDLTIFRRIYRIGLEILRKFVLGNAVLTEKKPGGIDIYLSANNTIENETETVKQLLRIGKISKQLLSNDKVVKQLIRNGKIAKQMVRISIVAKQMLRNGKVAKELLRNGKIAKRMLRNGKVAKQLLRNGKIAKRMLRNGKVAKQLLRNVKVAKWLLRNGHKADVDFNTKIAEIIADMTSLCQDHFLYDERNKLQGAVGGELRKMVDVLKKAENDKMKKQVLRYYHSLRIQIPFVSDVESYRIMGNRSNITEILQWTYFTGIHDEGYPDWIQQFPNATVSYQMPNLTIWRRIYNIGLEFLRKLLKGDVVVTEKKNHGNVDVYLSGKTKTEKGGRGSLLRRLFGNHRSTRDTVETYEQKMDKKLAEITSFCSDHLITANYLYDEIQRIKTQRTVIDDLRQMVKVLDKPQNVIMKNRVLKFYRLLVDKKEKKALAERAHKPNHLIINTVINPFDYGFDN